METISNFATSLRDRTRSPFYGAFILAWLITNWRIVVAVFFFEQEDLSGNNLVDFIEQNYINVWNCLLWPLLYGVIVYIVIIPWVDYFAMWYTEWVRQEKKKRKLKVQELYPVSGKTYVELLTRMEKQSQLVVEFESKAKEAAETIKQRNEEIDKLEASELHQELQIQEIESELGQLRQRKSFNDRFKGRWTFILDRSSDMSPVKEQINVQSNLIRFIDKKGSDSEWTVIHIDLDVITSHFVFAIKNKNNVVKLYDLQMISDSRFEGFENSQHRVIFERDIVTLNQTSGEPK